MEDISSRPGGRIASGGSAVVSSPLRAANPTHFPRNSLVRNLPCPTQETIAERSAHHGETLRRPRPPKFKYSRDGLPIKRLNPNSPRIASSIAWQSLQQHQTDRLLLLHRDLAATWHRSHPCRVPHSRLRKATLTPAPRRRLTERRPTHREMRQRMGYSKDRLP